MRRFLPATLLALGLLAAVPATALADHNSNNRATFTGAASGTAIANYAEGQGTFNLSVSARDLAPGTYTYSVSLNGGNVRLICGFTVTSGGTGGCTANDVALPGFNRAELRPGDAEGVLDSATFVRQGRSECRDPNQAGAESATCPNRDH